MFKINFPKLRLPSWSEFWALFLVSTHVGAIVTGIERQAKALEGVMAHQFGLADKHEDDAAASRRAALASAAKASAAVAEASRAARVSGKLAALVA